MREPTHTDIAAVEALLRSCGNNRTTRDMQPGRGHRGMFNVRAVIATCAAVFVFAPASAVTTIFLLTTDSVGLDLSPIEAGSRALLKSDRLGTFNDASASVQGGTGTDEFVRVVATTVERPANLNAVSEAAAALPPLLIRGRLDDELIVAANDIAPVQITASPRHRRPIARIKQPPLKVVAEAVPPETKPPSLLERLFGPLSL